ncbi:unnamed protein product [Sphagnum jensenii]|jgi:DnaJ family protein C protein 2|uniref:DnaJ-like protein n=1 Tax=Sphagnum jensenii TaxID=128206 RepID=A0ABP0X082_9BRYO
MPGAKDRLLLTYFASDIPATLPLFVASNSLPTPAFHLEPAGVSFHALAFRALGFDEELQGDDESVAEKKDKSGSSPSAESYQFKGKKKSGDGPETQDHYALLGLSHLRFLATEDQIRKAYREAALKHHPDKQAALLLTEETEEKRQTKKEEIDQHFKSIQLAYEVLIDPVKRRAYDSVDEFDDEVPTDCGPDDFFKVFGPVFMRNGRWSVIQPVPSLGDDDSDIATVDKFYDFWYMFKSWREFPHADEFDLEEAETREHKRWMERQNNKLREKAKKEENSRIRLLVDNSYKRDPRIARRKEEEKAEKARKKEAKIQAKREKEEEAARILEEEKLRKEEEEKRAAEEVATQKKIKEKEKKLLRKEKARLRTAATAVILKGLGVSEDDVENLCTSLDISLLKVLCDRLEGITEIAGQAEYLRNVISGVEPLSVMDSSPTLAMKTAPQAAQIFSPLPPTSTGMKGSQTEVEKPPVEVRGQEKKVTGVLNAGEKKEKPWSKEEVDLLRKAVIKFPKGTSQRWEVVSNYVGTGRSVEEILKAVKTVLMQKPDSTKAFDSFLQTRKTGNVVINSPLSTREDEAGDLQAGKAASKPVANGSARAGEKTQKGIEEKSQGKSETEENEDSQKYTQSNGSVGNGAVSEQELWSDIQEVALVKAIKAFPKDTDKRWDRIASAVPGKTKAQCFKKFAELRENFRSKKTSE